MDALIVDDELKARETLKGLLSIIDPTVTVINEASTVVDAVQMLKDSDAEVLFLDIELLDGTGFDILQKTDHIKPKVVFTTAYDQYALEAFRNNAIDYLLKPINMDELKESLEKVKIFNGTIEQTGSIQKMMSELSSRMNGKRISINCSNKLTIVEVDNILYCQSDSSYCNVHLVDGTEIMSSSTLKTLEAELIDDGFFRVNNSYLVNLSKVRSLNKSVNHGELLLDNGEKIEVSRRKKSELVQLLTNN